MSLQTYIRNLIRDNLQNHPYFSRLIRSDGSVDSEGFLTRYELFLNAVPILTKSTGGTFDVFGLTEAQKRVLLLRAGSEGRQMSRKEIANKCDLPYYGVASREETALNRFRRTEPFNRAHGYVDIMDYLLLKEYEALEMQGIEPIGFDVEYMKDLKDKRQIRQTVGPSLEVLGLSNVTHNALRRAGIEGVNQLEEKSDEELLKMHWLGRLRLHEIRQKLEEYHLSNPKI